MGWDVGEQKVVRKNPDYLGDDVWQQDMSAKIKIIAQRHDFHDQDLADAISECLHTGGLNKMTANLNLNGYDIINLSPASQLALKNNLIDTMTFDNPTRTLTLTSPAGLNLTAVIPDETGGGGGTGSVTSIAAGAGLVATPSPITTTGTISLQSIVSGQTYSGGIQTITVDNYGRVTQVTAGALGGTNLGLANVGVETLQITSSTGNAVTVPAATTSAAGLMKKADKAKLDGIATGANNYSHPNHTGEVTSSGGGAQTLQASAIGNRSSMTGAQLAAADEVLVKDSTVLKRLSMAQLVEYLQGELNMSLPVPSVITGATRFSNIGYPYDGYQPYIGLQSSGTKTGSNSWKTLYSYNGSGILEMVALHIMENSGSGFSYSAQVRLKIDGNVVLTSDPTAPNEHSVCFLIGQAHITNDFVEYQMVPFSTSFAVEMIDGGAIDNAKPRQVLYRYQRT